MLLITVFFSFRWNTLDYLFSTSYERYIWIHKLAGHLIIPITFMHGYSLEWENNTINLDDDESKSGWIAFFFIVGFVM